MTGQQEQLVCARCGPLEQALRSLQEQLDEQAQELREAHQTRRTLERKITTIARAMDDLREEIKADEGVKAVFEFWKTETGASRCRLSRDRAELISQMLKQFSVEELCQAISGAVLKPYRWYGVREVYPRRQGQEMELKLAQIIGKADHVESNIRIYAAAGHAALYRLQRMWQFYEQFNAVASVYGLLAARAEDARAAERRGDLAAVAAINEEIDRTLNGPEVDLRRAA